MSMLASATLVGSALHVMLFLENDVRAALQGSQRHGYWQPRRLAGWQ